MRNTHIPAAMEEFRKTLSRIKKLKEEGDWDEAIKIVGSCLNALLRIEPEKFRQLTETELLARLIRTGSTAWVPCKKVMLISLLKETGDYAAVKDPPGGGYRWYIKALHLLLDCLAHEELNQYSSLVPQVEVLLSALGSAPLPVRTRLLLMREYERKGLYREAVEQFAEARLDAPSNVRLIRLGIAFFERLQSQGNATLSGGGVLRRDVDAMRAKLQAADREFDGWENDLRS
jgi:hypothetical protein